MQRSFEEFVFIFKKKNLFTVRIQESAKKSKMTVHPPVMEAINN